MNFLKFLIKIPANLLAVLITAYQKILSPDHGLLRKLFPYGYCKFSPSCSEYAKESIKKYGVLKGGFKAFWRILRCNPWTKGGQDSV